MSERVTIAGHDVAAHIASIVCRHVVEAGEVRIFAHDDDGTMQFLCGCELDVNQAMVVGVSHVLEWHPDLAKLPTVSPGFWAERSERGAPWVVKSQIEED